MTGRASDMSGINELGIGIGDIVYWYEYGNIPTFARIASMTCCTAKAEVVRHDVRNVNSVYGMPHVVPTDIPTGEVVRLRVHKNGSLYTQGTSHHVIRMSWRAD
jgi:hypothetical protein